MLSQQLVVKINKTNLQRTLLDNQASSNESLHVHRSHTNGDRLG